MGSIETPWAGKVMMIVMNGTHQSSKQKPPPGRMTMLKALLKKALEDSPSSTCKECASLCNTQSAEKQKAEKAANTKGKKKSTKVSLKKDHGGYDEWGGGDDAGGDY